MSRPVAAAAPSLIMALHAQYEAAWANYHAIEDATPAAQDAPPVSAEWCRKVSLDDAGAAATREIDALRLSICYQVPSTWEEVLVLAYHVYNVAEVGNEVTEEDRQAFEAGYATMLDFMFGELDHEGFSGQMMNSWANTVYSKRRLRTGVLETAEA